MFRKIKRIFLKSILVLILSLLLLLGMVLIGIQTFGFQTWLAGRAASWLSTELNTTVHISRVELEFFRSANLRNILILDQKKDTLLSGDLLVDMSGFNFKQQKVHCGLLCWSRKHRYNSKRMGCEIRRSSIAKCPSGL
jgi:hypothetical protein